MRSRGKNAANVQVIVLLRAEHGPRGEHLWATPVDATDAGGTYRLVNNGYLCPLVIDDVVEARLNADSLLQVTGVRRRGGRPGWWVIFEEAVEEAEIQRLCEAWTRTGTAIERGSAVAASLALAKTGGTRRRPDESGFLGLQIGGVVRDFEQTSAGSVLTAREAAEIDFELQRELSPELEIRHTTNYWVGDDPYWVEHGISDPGFLAYIQRLAHEDVQVARALELGKHHQVLRYLETMSMNPSEWAHLPDESIFDADTLHDV